MLLFINLNLRHREAIAAIHHANFFTFFSEQIRKPLHRFAENRDKAHNTIHFNSIHFTSQGFSTLYGASVESCLI